MGTTGNLVSPRQAARAVGVSESSLKRWCDRGLIATVRTAGGHRKLASADVLQFVREQSHRLVSPEVLGLPATSDGAELGLTRGGQRLAEALLAGDEELARGIVFDLYLAKHPVSVICDRVVAGAFREIGDRWACREADVYQERRGCEIVLQILHELRRTIGVPDVAPTAIGATIEGDHYTLPSAMTEVVLREAGYRAAVLGSAIPFASLVKAVEEVRPKLFWLSVSYIADGIDFVTEFAQLSQACAAVGAALVVGGRALTDELRPQLNYTAYCDTLRHLETFAVAVRQTPKRTPRRNAAPRSRPVAKQKASPIRRRK